MRNYYNLSRPFAEKVYGSANISLTEEEMQKAYEIYCYLKNERKEKVLPFEEAIYTGEFFTAVEALFYVDYIKEEEFYEFEYLDDPDVNVDEERIESIKWWAMKE